MEVKTFVTIDQKYVIGIIYVNHLFVQIFFFVQNLISFCLQSPSQYLRYDVHFIMVMNFHDISLFQIIYSQSKTRILKKISYSDGFLIDSWVDVQVFISDSHIFEKLIFLALQFQGYRRIEIVDKVNRCLYQ